MDFSTVTNIPFPSEQVERLLTGGYRNRIIYIETREALRAWQDSVGISHQPLDLGGTIKMELEFVNRQLSRAELQKSEEWLVADDTDVVELLNKLMKAGYRLSVVYESKTETFMASLIGKSAQCPNVGRCLPTRHGSVAAAIDVSLFKHFVIFNGELWGELEGDGLFG